MAQVNFGEAHVWFSYNIQLKTRTVIHGPLAEILQQYPSDHKIHYIGKDPAYVDSASAN